MVLFLIAAHAVAQPFPHAPRSTEPISIVYPKEGMSLPALPYEFVIGSVLYPKGLLEVNGQTVAVRQNGAFLAWIPVIPGTFTITANLVLPGGVVHRLDRHVTFAQPPAPLPAQPVSIDAPSAWPREDQELRAGDWLLARFKGSPGGRAEFRVKGLGWQPMRESHPALGLYEGSYQVRPEDERDYSRVEFRLKTRYGSAKAEAPGRAAFRRGTPAVAIVRGGPVAVRTGPGEGDLFYALSGMRFLVGGRIGAESKVLLSGGQTGWVETRSLEFLLPGAHPPRAETASISFKGTPEGTSVRVSLGDRVPFIVEESDDMSAIMVRFHYAYAHTNWMIYGSTDDFVQEVRLKQETSDVVLLTVRLQPGRVPWGWQTTYEGNVLRLDLKRPPPLPAKGSPLAGVKVFLDPGHMPSAPGALGPLGTREMDVNFALAKAVEALLRKEQALPLLSRKGPDDEVGLAERARLAAAQGADVFISLHHNFLGPGQNPLSQPFGHSTFYYHPHSLALAREIYQAYLKRVPLPGEELRFGDLLVIRQTAMPAVLVETAYLTLPEQEELALDARFRAKAAAAVVEGLRRFLEAERARQHKERRRP